MSIQDYIEEIVSILKTSYPDMEFRSYHNSITASIKIDNTSDYILLELTDKRNLNSVSVYEENWLKSKKWICYNKSYSEMYGHGSRFGGENPIEVFKEALENLHYRLNIIIKRAKLSEIFLQKTNGVIRSENK